MIVRAMKPPRPGLLVGILTLAVLAVSVPGSLREARAHGAFYVFSTRFFEDLPKRLAGPGRLRFVIQPAVAILLGWKAGRADAQAGRPAFLHRLFIRPGERAAAVAESIGSAGVLILMGILLDSIFQWVLLGVSYPGAALVVGPVLITIPYVAARTMAGAFRSKAPAQT
jgi:hypothetical protein